MYLPKSPGQCSTRLTTIGSRNRALITRTGTQSRRSPVKRETTAEKPCRHATTATAQTVISGTKNRKQACPWMSSQPASVMIQTSRAAPAATLAAASRKTTYVSTYMYGIQSELSTPGCQTPRKVTAAVATRAPDTDLVQP